MGGFLVNGCGVGEHLKNIKSLGMHSCPNCKKLTEFTLAEAKQKIDVLWIPTLTLKSRYAVMCKKCKDGEICSTEWVDYLMGQTADQDIIFESDAKAKGWLPETGAFQEQQSKMFCFNCGKQIEVGSGFCPFCGAGQNTQQ